LTTWSLIVPSSSMTGREEVEEDDEDEEGGPPMDVATASVKGGSGAAALGPSNFAIHKVSAAVPAGVSILQRQLS
jgi:hypothetical protein